MYVDEASLGDAPSVGIELPRSAGAVRCRLIAIEERPGGFFWLRVVIPLWHRDVMPTEPFTESIAEGGLATWVPIDAVAQLREGSFTDYVEFLSQKAYAEVLRLAPGEGRPEDAPRFPMPWET